jgi:hypothetical protein
MVIACYSSILWPKYLLQNITTAARNGHPRKTPGGSDMSCRKSHKPREEKAIKWQEKCGSNGFSIGKSWKIIELTGGFSIAVLDYRMVPQKLSSSVIMAPQ